MARYKIILRHLCLLALVALPLSSSTEACDTWVALPDSTVCGHTVLGKNSDRLNFDCQPLFLHPRAQWPAGAEIDLGRVKIPQVAETFATLGSSPYWCWGYEEGINEFGVAIGNEGIRTKVLTADHETHRRNLGPEFGPTGMDLIRLGLERGRTAFAALNEICKLVEEHGQYGSGLPTLPAIVGGYDNSFIIADAKEAWILETAGRHWAARRAGDGVTSISNTPSITTNWDLVSPELESHAVSQGWWEGTGSDVFDFTRAFQDESPQGTMTRDRSVPRAECSEKLMRKQAGGVTIRGMMGIARDRSSLPAIDQDVTASSCVAVLPAGDEDLPVFWWCPSVPSTSCYIPFFVHGSALPEYVSKAGKYGRKITPPRETLPDKHSADSYWWRFRTLCDQVRVDYEVRNPIARAEFDALETAFAEALPQVAREAVALRTSGDHEAAARVLDGFTTACLEEVLQKRDELHARFSDSTATPDQGDDGGGEPAMAPRLERLVDLESIETNAVRDETIFDPPSEDRIVDPNEESFLSPEDRQRNVESFDVVWNIINDRYWDRTFNNNDWEELRDRLRPRVAAARTMEESRDLFYDLFNPLGTSHFGIFPADSLAREGQPDVGDEPYGVPGIDLRIVDGRALVTRVFEGSPAAKAGVHPGWELLEADGVGVRARLHERLTEIEDNSKRELHLTYSILPLLFGDIGTTVQARFLDEEEREVEHCLERLPRKGSRINFGDIAGLDVWFESLRLDGNVGYIAFNRFFDPMQVMKGFNEAMANFLDTRGIIIDLRGNEGGQPEIAFGMMGWLVDEPHFLGTVFMRDMERKIMIQPRAVNYDGPVAVLVDGLSGSASEVMAGGLKDIGRAVVVGTRTKGEVVPGALHNLPNGDMLIYSTDNFISVTGRRPEGLGVEPDIEVAPAREALLAGRDLVIEAAAEWIQSQH